MNKINVKIFISKIAVLMLLVLVPLTANATQLITNGGFESGLFGWSCTGADLCTTNNDGIGGSAAAFGYDNSGFATLSQTISTTPGGLYDFSFFSKAYQISGNQLGYSFSGFGNAVFVDTTTSYAQTVGSFLATAGTTSVEFYFATDPGTGTWLVDDVSVQAGQSVVPEPGTMMLLGLGMVGLAIYGKRRAKA